jgi:hypothetical protein
MSESHQHVCRPVNGDLESRGPQLQRLRSAMMSERTSVASATFVFAPSARATVLEFVRDESECCGFFGFTIESNAQDISLTVEAPSGGEAMLQALVEGLRGDIPVADLAHGLESRGLLERPS